MAKLLLFQACLDCYLFKVKINNFAILYKIGEKGKQLLSDPTLTKEKLSKIVEDYRKAGPTPEVVKKTKQFHKKKKKKKYKANLGFSPKSYFFSKAAINAYTRFILRKQMVKN